MYNRDNNLNDGKLIVARRPKSSSEKKASDFQICHHWKRRYARGSIRKHRKRCLNESSSKHRENAVLSRKAESQLHKDANKQFRDKVFPVLKNDNVVDEIRWDGLLVKFANRLCDRYPKPHQHNMIRSRLRLLGRLLIRIKAINKEITDFASIFSPRHYNSLIEAIMLEAKFIQDSYQYGTPSVATTLGEYIKKAGRFLAVDCIMGGDPTKRKQVKDFLTVHESEFHVRISKHALASQAEQKRQTKKPLPTVDDIQTLWKYLEIKSAEAYDQLSAKYSYGSWMMLSKTLLIKLQLFNRKRAGEIERFTIKDLKRAEMIDESTDPELYNSLSAEDKLIVQEYRRVEIEGKRDRIVPVLLSKTMRDEIELVLRHRKNAGVTDKNPHLFGVPGSSTYGRNKYLQACKLMKEFSVDCGASHPERLRGTFLRKQMAPSCAAQNVEENKIYDISNFMGHSEAIHRAYYRQPVATRDVVTVSKFFEAALGSSTRHQQKSADNNNNDDIENIESNGGRQDNSLDRERAENFNPGKYYSYIMIKDHNIKVSCCLFPNTIDLNFFNIL